MFNKKNIDVNTFNVNILKNIFTYVKFFSQLLV